MVVERHLVGSTPAAPEAVPVASLVDCDAIDPGTKRRLTSELADRAEHPDEDVLREIERLVAVAKQVHRELDDHALVLSDQIGKRQLISSGAPLNEFGLADTNFGPVGSAYLLHAFHVIEVRPRRQLKVPADASGCYDTTVVKRALFLTGLLAIAAVGGALAYRATAREQSYRLLLASGEAALNADDTVSAIEAFSGAITVRPDAMLARLRRGETYRRRGDFDVAARDFRSAAALDPTATRPLEALGDVLFSQGRYRRAVETYQAWLKLDDRSPAIRHKLALALYRDGAIELSLEEARRAFAQDDRLADAHYLAALCLRDLFHTDEAIGELQRAISLAPTLVAAREELADVFQQQGRYEDQLQQLQVLASIDGKNPERHLAVGVAQAQAGKVDLALATLTDTLDLTTDDARVNAALGKVWLQLAADAPQRDEALPKALEALERAASALSATSETKTLYGKALLRSGQLDAAEQLFQQASQRFPVSTDGLIELANVADSLKHWSVARTALMTYLSLAGTSTQTSSAAARIGTWSLQLNDPATAVTWLETAVAQDPVNTSLQTLLSNARRRLESQAQFAGRSVTTGVNPPARQ